MIDQQQVDATKFDYEAWLRKVEAIRQDIKASHGGAMPSASDLVNEVRDERLDEIMRSVGFEDSAEDDTD